MKHYEFRFSVTFDALDDVEARQRGIALRRLVDPANFLYNLRLPVVAVLLREIYADKAPRGIVLPGEV